MINLDFLCMKTAQAMVSGQGTASEKENTATKGLGVLLENGPYGLMLYLQTAKSAVAQRYRDQLLGLCRERMIVDYLAANAPTGNDFQAVTTWLRTVAEDLDRYLFTKRLWQQTLTYARYHAKATDDERSATPSEVRGTG